MIAGPTFKIHGDWRVKAFPQHRILLHMTQGSWNEDASLQYAEQMLTAAQYMPAGKWAILADTRNFRLGTPEVFEVTLTMVNQMLDLGLEYTVDIMECQVTRHMHQFVDQRSKSPGTLHQTDSLDSALTMLKQKGFDFPRELAEDFFASSADEMGI